MSSSVARRFAGALFKKAIHWAVSWLRTLTVVAAFSYPALLVATALALAYVGERWWVTTLALYAPRIVLGGPLPVLVAALILFRKRALLWTQLLALLVLIFPLMGLSIPWFTGKSETPVFRVMSFNANSGYAGIREIGKAIQAISPDIVVLQEAERQRESFEMEIRKLYPHVESSTQFILGSRFPIIESTPPEKLPYWGRTRSPRFMRYAIRTPGGDIAVYSVHPASPRGVLQLHRFRGILGMLRRGELFVGDPAKDVGDNTGLRTLQVEAIAQLAADEALPLVIAGDTNLPVLSPLFRKNLGRYEDGFEAASSGFGYTYPEKYPWMRIDRILASEALRFVAFHTGCPDLSDHLCVYADLQQR